MYTAQFGNAIEIDRVSLTVWGIAIRESPPQFENRIMARVYVKSIICSTMYQRAPFGKRELAYGKLVL